MGLFRRAGERLIRDPRDLRLGDVVKSSSSCSSECLCIAGVPWDWSTAGRPGARFAPSRLREHLYSYNVHEDLCLCDWGDVGIVPGDLGSSSQRIYEAVKQLARSCRGFLLLGGDHSITRYSVASALDILGGRAGLVVFDAHLDLRELSEGLSSGTYLRELIAERGDMLGVIVIGVRPHSVPRYMFELADMLGVEYIYSEDLEIGIAIDRLNKTLSGASWVYVSFDSDSLDPSQCPGVNSPSPLGISLREAIDILDHIAERHRVVGADIVEYTPHLDQGDLCGRSLALIAYRILRNMWSQARYKTADSAGHDHQ